MSKQIPKDELNKKLSYRFKQWFSGEADTYVGILESIPQKEIKPDQKLMKSHQKDQEHLIEMVHDTEHNKVYKNFFRFYRVTAMVCCVALITILLIAVSYLPPVGNADNPAHNEVVDKYIEDGLQDTGAVNVVTGMILDYRAFDTFGESNVLFIATCTVLILMRNDKKKPRDRAHSDRHWEPKSDAILQNVTFVLFPIIVIYGIYVVLNGHLSPGGGFSGGAIIGAGLILYLNAYGTEKTRKFFTEKTYKYISFAALLFYCLSKAYSFYTGAHHLESGIPLGTPGAIISAGLILPLNICVGLVVACTMYAFYTLFRKEGF